METALAKPIPNHLVALTPQEVPAEQAKLADFCLAKMRELGANYQDVRRNIQIAKANKWQRSGLDCISRKLRREIQYFTKIRAAVQAGYLVVPNFDVEIMAVRIRTSKWKARDPKDNVEKYFASSQALGLLPPAFPVSLVKPIILSATERAMGLRLFDRIGVVTGRKKDPVVVGEILHPGESRHWQWSNRTRRVSFFIAWWLDVRSL